MNKIKYTGVTLLIILISFSCTKRNWNNPYDEKADDNIWTISDVKVELVSASACKLSWKSSIYNFDQIIIDRLENDGQWDDAFASLESNATQWVDDQVEQGITYKYRIHFIAGNVQKLNHLEIRLPKVPELVFVKGGEFQMGTMFGNENERPAHQVRLNDYYMGKYEVTQEEWEDVMGGNPSFYTDEARLPVENVTWHDAQAYINKLNALTKMNFRLPTEAEWEYAATGGANGELTSYSGSNNINEVAWNYSNSNNRTHPVGTKAPNELGIYDMSGNVYEWCYDWYSSGYYSQSPFDNPTGPESGTQKVERGGCFRYEPESCKVRFRLGLNPENDYSSLGFRVVLDAN